MWLEILLTSVLGFVIYWFVSRDKEETLPLEDGWWGPGARPAAAEDESIRPFKVETSEEEIEDLHWRIDRVRLTPPLEDVRFHFGFNSKYLRKVLSYWRNGFDWRKQVEILNRYPHFKTKIEGLNSVATARIFYKLMLRLGFQEFYVQGGDWGSLICTNMAQMVPSHVKGLHLNMAFVLNPGTLTLLLGRRFPRFFGYTQRDIELLYPFKEKVFYSLMRESGYMHIQGTKPDTVGCALNDSPVGLAAYILEKFSTWTNPEFRDLEDGGLDRKFSLDDLLTNVMLYWTTGTITSSQRFYKENLGQGFMANKHDRIKVHVPTGFAAFPCELMHVPEKWVKFKYPKLLSYSYMARGGHFAAFEEPELLAQDIGKFVGLLEQG
ncbi:epoxide hydrolase 1 isoform X2 [Leptonychotes weddellii]|uniref:Epoxide hydrolase n=1 Tax=Leptonychotes weddellii TaxID=9713 RepID=A0A7F8RKZ9_LEPWE|nr:epoxide hydrolase 1 isoform X2 [Leptonychotes weddellii]